jgi:hypothetical protein
MPRRPARHTQADVARALRAAKQAGAAAVVVFPDGSIKILLESPPLAPEQAANTDPFLEWERAHEQAKTSGHRDRV